MKVLQNGKEVKDAQVLYSNGTPLYVRVDGVTKDVAAFELVEDEPQKKTTAVSAKKTTDANAEVMTTRKAPAKRTSKKAS